MTDSAPSSGNDTPEEITIGILALLLAAESPLEAYKAIHYRVSDYGSQGSLTKVQDGLAPLGQAAPQYIDWHSDCRVPLPESFALHARCVAGEAATQQARDKIHSRLRRAAEMMMKGMADSGAYKALSGRLLCGRIFPCALEINFSLLGSVNPLFRHAGEEIAGFDKDVLRRHLLAAVQLRMREEPHIFQWNSV